MKYQHLLSRKFITGMSAIIGANVSLGFGWINETAYCTIILASLAIYQYANVTQKQTEKKVPDDPA